jgi:hypothetical protein
MSSLVGAPIPDDMLALLRDMRVKHASPGYWDSLVDACSRLPEDAAIVGACVQLTFGYIGAAMASTHRGTTCSGAPSCVVAALARAMSRAGVKLVNLDEAPIELVCEMQRLSDAYCASDAAAAKAAIMNQMLALADAHFYDKHGVDDASRAVTEDVRRLANAYTAAKYSDAEAPASQALLDRVRQIARSAGAAPWTFVWCVKLARTCLWSANVEARAASILRECCAEYAVSCEAAVSWFAGTPLAPGAALRALLLSCGFD